MKLINLIILLIYICNLNISQGFPLENAKQYKPETQQDQKQQHNKEDHDIKENNDMKIDTLYYQCHYHSHKVHEDNYTRDQHSFKCRLEEPCCKYECCQPDERCEQGHCVQYFGEDDEVPEGVIIVFLIIVILFILSILAYNRHHNAKQRVLNEHLRLGTTDVLRNNQNQPLQQNLLN